MSSSTEPLSEFQASSENSTNSKVSCQAVSNQHLSEEVQNDIDELLENVPQLKESFNILDKIGTGTFSSVYLASLKEMPARQFALKHIVPTSHPSRTENELRCLKDIGGHDNVIGVSACLRERDNVVIIMQYCPHDRFQDYVGCLSMFEIQLYIRSLLVALRRVHSYDIIHRDIKPSNFLYSRQLNRFSLVDFGLAQKTPARLKLESQYSKNKAGLDTNKDEVSKNKIKTPSPMKRKKGKDENVSHDPKKISPNRKIEDDKIQTIETKDNKVEVSKFESLNEDEKIESKNSTNDVKSVFPGTYSKSLKLLKTGKTSHNSADLNVPTSVKKTCSDVDNCPKETVSNVSTVGINSRTTEKTGSRQECLKPDLPLCPTKNFQFDTNRKRNVARKPFPKLCDCFGNPTVCRICLSKVPQNASRAGTPGFRAPEVLMKYPDQTTAVDIWAAGVIFISLLSGCYPFFKARDDISALGQIMSLLGSEEVKAAASTYGKVVISSPAMPPVDLEQYCQKLRASLNSTDTRVLDIPSSAFELLRRLLDLNPKTRITAEEALKHPFFNEKFL